MCVWPDTAHTVGNSFILIALCYIYMSVQYTAACLLQQLLVEDYRP